MTDTVLCKISYFISSLLALNSEISSNLTQKHKTNNVRVTKEFFKTGEKHCLTENDEAFALCFTKY